MHLFEELNKLGTTVIIATHNNQMVERMGYPRMHLDEGWLKIIGGNSKSSYPKTGLSITSKGSDSGSAKDSSVDSKDIE
jgi:ABC-type polysaccharide/polyol phosphate transport system ATPase subunit